jgi:hypothetical protein
MFIPAGIFFLLGQFLLDACSKKDENTVYPPPDFETVPISSPVTPGLVDEASGIADSRSVPGYLWVQEDSDNPNAIHLLSHSGAYLKKIVIDGATNRDWEDIVVSSGPDAGKFYIYLAETGDNNNAYTQYYIYRFPEPGQTTDTVRTYDKIAFSYPDGPHDAEAILVEPNSRDIYIITKRESRSLVYRLAYPYDPGVVHIVTKVAELGYNFVVSATVTASVDAILVKTYGAVYYYQRNGKSIAETLQQTPVTIPYVLEQQGEAITYKLDNTGYFTLSERNAGAVTLNLYREK